MNVQQCNTPQAQAEGEKHHQNAPVYVTKALREPEISTHTHNNSHCQKMLAKFARPAPTSSGKSSTQLLQLRMESNDFVEHFLQLHTRFVLRMVSTSGKLPSFSVKSQQTLIYVCCKCCQHFANRVKHHATIKVNGVVGIKLCPIISHGKEVR